MVAFKAKLELFRMWILKWIYTENLADVCYLNRGD